MLTYSMAKVVDRTGQKFGRLTFVRHIGGRQWELRCDCGGTYIGTSSAVASGNTKSCGCLLHDRLVERNTKHGMARRGGLAREYWVWSAAKDRCFNPRNAAYPNYGGRGITMCERWRNDFGAFMSDMGERPPGHTIDRINVNGNYEPANCRWATRGSQARNKRNNVYVQYEGRRVLFADAARLSGLSSSVVARRMQSGWPPDEWFSPPMKTWSRKHKHGQWPLQRGGKEA